MKMYVKGYVQRVMTFITAVVVILASLLLCYGLFRYKLNRVGAQLNSYNSADYSLIYILNYGASFSNECLYPDTDVQFFLDSECSHRLTVSSIMREDGVVYNLEYLVPLSCLMPGEACISQNVADVFKISIGDTIYAEYSYSHTPEPVVVSSIMQTEYDYEYPNIDNDIGIVFLGYNEKYAANTSGKYILFAEESKAEELAVFPQIINSVINKSECIDDITTQGSAALLFEAIFTLISIILAHFAFFSKSYMPLYRCYLKGMNRFLMAAIPFMERMALCLFLCGMVQFAVTSTIPDCSVTKGYRMIPFGIYGLYCVLMLAVDLLKSRRKGEKKWNS